MSSSHLLDSVVLSDAALTSTKAKMDQKAHQTRLSFVSVDMICQSAVSGTKKWSMIMKQPTSRSVYGSQDHLCSRIFVFRIKN